MGETLKNVTMTKFDQLAPVWQLVEGDTQSSGVCLKISRYDSGVDLSTLGWCVKVTSGEDSDICVIEAEDITVSDMWVTFEWLFPAVCAANVGVTEFSVEAVDEDENVIWKSGRRTIQVIEGLTATAGYDPEALSEFEKTVSTVGVKVANMSTAMDGYEARISAAETSANEAAGTADNAAESAVQAAQAAETAAETADRAAENAQDVADAVQAKLDSGAFKGDKGDDGAAGRDGADWVPTSAELESIAGEAAEKLQPTISELTTNVDSATETIGDDPASDELWQTVLNKVEAANEGYSSLVDLCLKLPQDSTGEFVLAKLTAGNEILANILTELEGGLRYVDTD